MRASPAWVTRSQDLPKDSGKAPAVNLTPSDDKGDEVKATVIDASLPESAGECEMDDKRGAKHTRNAGSSPTKPPKAQRVEDVCGLGPDGVQLWDLGGFGDCGFRCLAAGNAMRQGAVPSKVKDKIAKVALSLRTKATDWLENNQGAWVLEWYSDAECSEQTEAGAIPQDASEYLQACRRPAKWLDPWLTMAAAHVLQVEVLVFKHLHGKWKFLERVVPRQTVSSSPLMLFLKDNHFYTLPPSETPPEKWAKLGLDDSRPLASQSYLGGGGKSPKGAPSSVGSDLSRWLQPAPDGRNSCRSLGSSTKLCRSEEKDSEASLWLRPAQSEDGYVEGPSRAFPPKKVAVFPTANQAAGRADALFVTKGPRRVPQSENGCVEGPSRTYPPNAVAVFPTASQAAGSAEALLVAKGPRQVPEATVSPGRPSDSPLRPRGAATPSVHTHPSFGAATPSVVTLGGAQKSYVEPSSTELLESFSACAAPKEVSDPTQVDQSPPQDHQWRCKRARVQGKQAPTVAYTTARSKDRNVESNIGVKPYISRIPTLRLRQGGNPNRLCLNPARKPQGGLPAFPEENLEQRKLWWPCPYCSYRVFTGPGEFARPDEQRRRHLSKVHGVAKVPDLRHTTSLTHGITRKTAAKNSFDKRWARMFQKFSQGRWAGAHDICEEPTSWLQIKSKQGKTSFDACHRCKTCGLEIVRKKVPLHLCPKAKIYSKPLTLAERTKLWKQWRQEASLESGCLKALRKARDAAKAAKGVKLGCHKTLRKARDVAKAASTKGGRKLGGLRMKPAARQSC